MSRSGLTHPRRDLRFRHENVQLLGRKFYSASRFCFPAGFSPGSWRRAFFLAGSRRVQISRRDSCRDTRREFFPGRIPPWKRATSAGSRWAPGYLAGSRRDPSTYFTRDEPIVGVLHHMENSASSLHFLHIWKLPKSSVYLVFDWLNNSSLVFTTSWQQIVVCVAVTFIQLFVM